MTTKDIKDLKGLEGQNVGVISLVDSTYYLLVMMMRAQGADPTKVQWRVVGGGAGRANALVAGGIKAAMFQVGQAIELMDKGPYQVLPASNDGLNDFIFKAFWAKRLFLKAPGPRRGDRARHLLATREALDNSGSCRLPCLARADVAGRRVRSYDILLKMGPGIRTTIS